MNVLKNNEIMNRPIVELLHVNNANTDVYDAAKHSLAYGMSLFSKRWKYYYKKDEITLDQNLKLNIYFGHLKNLDFYSKKGLISFFRTLRNHTMHYYHPLLNEKLELPHQVKVLLKEEDKNTKRDHLVLFHDEQLTLYGVIILLSLFLDDYTERTSFIKELSDGEVKFYTDFNYDCLKPLTRKIMPYKKKKLKVNKFFEQYMVSAFIRFSHNIEKHIVELNNKGKYINNSFKDTLLALDAKSVSNLIYIRNLGAHGYSINDYYKGNKVTFIGIMNALKSIYNEYANELIRNDIKKLCEVFLTYKYSVVCTKQLSFPTGNIHFLLDHIADLGLMGELESLQLKNEFLPAKGEEVIYDMFKMNLKLLHPSNKYRNQMKKLTGNEYIHMRMFTYYVFRNIANPFSIKGKVYNLDEVFLDSSYREYIKPQNELNKMEITYNSPYCLIYE